jgi:ferredoxin
VGVRPIKEGVRRDEDVCTHCGMCVSICPTRALAFDFKTGKVTFTEEKCVACGVCIDACPPRAMEILI